MYLVHARQGGAREVHQTGEGHVPSMRTVVRCAAGTSEPFAMEVGHHQRIRFQPCPVCHYDGFTDGKHERTNHIGR